MKFKCTYCGHESERFCVEPHGREFEGCRFPVDVNPDGTVSAKWEILGDKIGYDGCLYIELFNKDHWLPLIQEKAEEMLDQHRHVGEGIQCMNCKYGDTIEIIVGQ